MNALDFARDYKRMCDSFGKSCTNCPAYKSGITSSCNTIENMDILFPIVEKWAKEHQFVRNVDYVAEGLKKLGYKVEIGSLSYTCPVIHCGKFVSDGCGINRRVPCSECRKWWFEEYKGEE